MPEEYDGYDLGSEEEDVPSYLPLPWHKPLPAKPAAAKKPLPIPKIKKTDKTEFEEFAEIISKQNGIDVEIVAADPTIKALFNDHDKRALIYEIAGVYSEPPSTDQTLGKGFQKKRGLMFR